MFIYLYIEDYTMISQKKVRLGVLSKQLGMREDMMDFFGENGKMVVSPTNMA